MGAKTDNGKKLRAVEDANNINKTVCKVLSKVNWRKAYSIDLTKLHETSWED